jgi:pimeloyl-ACP methyl ester carboxylesterase
MTHERSLVADGSGRIDLVKCPVVILHGADDMVVPVMFAHEMKAAFGDRATLHVFEGVGHSMVTDKPSLFVETLKANA